ncbi:MAG: peptidoglycan DD-metalloendopeptidase family protein [Trueperella sp.]|nr:peptidoglycan DD-metalloendopeptidase family protein [Trueperella sp.]
MRSRLVAVVSAIAMALTGVLVAYPAAADERSNLVQQQEQRKNRISQLRAELEGVDKDIAEAFIALQEIVDKIPDAEKTLAEAEQELSAAQRKLDANTALLSAADAEVKSIDGELAGVQLKTDEAMQSLGELARSTYRGEVMPSTVEIIVGSSSAQDFLDAYRANSTVIRTQTSALSELEEQVAQTKNRQARQAAVKDRVDELKAESEALVELQKSKHAAAENARDELTNLHDKYELGAQQLRAKKQEIERQLAQTRQEQQNIAARIAQIDAQNRQEAQQGGGSVKPAVKGWLVPPIPVPLRVNSPFGMRNDPFGGRGMHYGVDLRSACRDPQRAPADGTVAFVGNYGAGGNAIFINHGMVGGSSYITGTLHLTGFNVRKGQRVKQGDLIGWTGTTGRSTGCHVHFEVWKNGTAINPMSFPTFVRG